MSQPATGRRGTAGDRARRLTARHPRRDVTRVRTVGLLAAVTVVVVGSVVASCGGDDADTAPQRRVPAVAEIVPAIEALEEMLGGPQEYFEINADHRLVNLFVSTDDGTTATAYLFVDGEVQPPAPPRPVEAGNTFGGDEVDFDADQVLARVATELPGSELATFVIVVGPTGTVRYEVLTRSGQGGTLAVEVLGDGTVLGVETL